MWLAHNAPVAQLDRALDYESRGREFESSRARHFLFQTKGPTGEPAPDATTTRHGGILVAMGRTTWIRLIATGLIAAGIGPGHIGAAVAALQTGEIETRSFEYFLPRSPVVLRIQFLLSELGLYEGPVDGRLNDDLETAVRRYQGGAGLEPDGRISDELLAHIEFGTEARELLARLDRVGAEQQKAARQKLAASPQTQALLDRSAKSRVADPTRDARPCFAAPTVDCLTHEAIETATAIHRPHFRDWVFGEIAVVQARAGKPAAARSSAARISDPRLIISALGNIAKAQADKGDLKSAQNSAEIIPDDWARADALIAVAVAQSRAGAWPEARETALGVEALLANLAGDRPWTPLLVRLAKGLFDAGDVSESISILDRHRNRLENLISNSEQNGVVSTAFRSLAAAYADLDQTDAALSLISSRAEDDRNRSAYLALSKALARAGNDAEAARMVGRMSEPRYRAVGWTNIARIQFSAQKFDVGRDSLAKAETAVREVDPSKTYARAHALKGIAETWVGFNDPVRAEKTARFVPNPALRAMVWRRIAKHYDERRDEANRTAAETAATRAVEAINSPLERVWHFTNLAISQSAEGNENLAARAFRAGLETAEKMSSVWARAQALTRLAAALFSLTQAQNRK